MAETAYTLGMWRVREGKEGNFVEAWKELSKLFSQLPLAPGGKGTLVQSLSDPLLFYSFGQWGSIEAVVAMRQDEKAKQGLRRLAEMCVESQPGSFRVVAEA